MSTCVIFTIFERIIFTKVKVIANFAKILKLKLKFLHFEISNRRCCMGETLPTKSETPKNNQLVNQSF